MPLETRQISKSSPFLRRNEKPVPLDRTSLADIKKKVSAPPTSLALLAAINECTRASQVPHPVRARNAGLVPAWRSWAAMLEAKVDHPMAEKVMASYQFGFDANVFANEGALDSDSVWHKGQVVKPASLNYFSTIATAPIMFWHRPNVMIEMTPALESLLERSDMGHDIPLDLLRPPAQACYIRFGEAMQTAVARVPGALDYDRIEGAYVFEAMRGSHRTVSFVAVYEAGQRLAVGNIELVIDDEQRPIKDLIDQMCRLQSAPSEAVHHQSLVQLCMKVFLYWKLDQGICREELPYTAAVSKLHRLGPKKAAKMGRRVDELYDRIILGPDASPEGGHGPDGEKQTHWRRGHFRMQPHGPQLSLRKVIFISPILVRADRQADNYRISESNQLGLDVLDGAFHSMPPTK